MGRSARLRSKWRGLRDTTPLERPLPQYLVRSQFSRLECTGEDGSTTRERRRWSFHEVVHPSAHHACLLRAGFVAQGCQGLTCLRGKHPPSLIFGRLRGWRHLWVDEEITSI